jgi:DNA-directed RNA polymerase subunit RPC12/RpoP
MESVQPFGSLRIRMVKPYECTQCGSTNFEDIQSNRVRCIHCNSMFQLITNEPKVVINKGAKVIFGKNADVEVRGDIDVQSGANVEIQGKVTVLRGGKKQEFNIKLIEDGKEKQTKK